MACENMYPGSLLKVTLKPLLVRSIEIIRNPRGAPKTARKSSSETPTYVTKPTTCRLEVHSFEPTIPIAAIQSGLSRPQFCKNHVAFQLAFAA